jgi:hypothetical protein
VTADPANIGANGVKTGSQRARARENRQGRLPRPTFKFNV